MPEPLPEILALSDAPLAAAVRDYVLGTYDRIAAIEAGAEREDIPLTELDITLRASLQAITNREVADATVKHLVTPGLTKAAIQQELDPYEQAFRRGLLIGAHAATLIPKEP